MNYKHTFQKYCNKHLYKNLNHSFYSIKKNYYKFFIIIPVYNELSYIQNTLNSIKTQKNKLLKNLLVIMVINNSKDESLEIIKNNKETHIFLKNKKYNFEHVILDFYSTLNALPKKKCGVGYARKIGMDFALRYSNENSLLCSLDADTILSKQYLNVINNFFYNSTIKVCTVNFKHQQSKDKEVEKGIRIYEAELKRIASKLLEAKSPYGYVSMGSTIVCRVSAYIAVCGMPKKAVTEDFYFLQSLAKFTKIYFIKNILVFPSSRCEQRVYLGTGARMKEYIEYKKFKNIHYSSRAYQLLNFFLNLTNKYSMKNYSIINNEIKNLSNQKLINFLQKNQFQLIWNDIKSSAKTHKQFNLFFNQWFDALKTIKFLKQLS